MNKILFICVITFSLMVSSSSFASDVDDWLKILNIPEWVSTVFHKKSLTKKYDFSFKINPMYLRGDFNGDNRNDVAILVKEKSSKKLGIIVIHYGSNATFILGAGKDFGNGGNDFYWMTNWAIQRKGKVSQGATDKLPPQIKGEALYVEKTESASGIIYWDGKQYIWYQQGD